jgi:hypothetical protein
LLDAGTKWVWVVRLTGPRRVEVHELGKDVVVKSIGDELLAPGVLQNPVRAEALWDRAAAHEGTLRNLLQRAGYASLDAVREEGREEGRVGAVLGVFAARGFVVSEAVRERVLACRDAALLDTWLRRGVTEASLEAAFGA